MNEQNGSLFAESTVLAQGRHDYYLMKLSHKCVSALLVWNWKICQPVIGLLHSEVKNQTSKHLKHSCKTRFRLSVPFLAEQICLIQRSSFLVLQRPNSFAKAAKSGPARHWNKNEKINVILEYCILFSKQIASCIKYKTMLIFFWTAKW